MGHTKLLRGDCREVLRTLADESVHCVVTSPPYWGLRDYGTAKWEGGDAECDHAKTQLRKGFISDSKAHREIGWLPYSGECGKCCARRIDSQIGLEPDFNAYIATMVDVFREVRRVLRKNGTLWLNLGDSYASTPPGTKRGVSDASTLHGVSSERYLTTLDNSVGQKRNTIVGGLKPKDLCGIPWRVAFALQADGWWLRQDIIWSKPNPMPESVTDRCTKSHEYLFLLSKSERYFYDAEAIREQGAEPDRERSDRIGGANGHTVRHSPGAIIGASATRNKRSVWEIATAPFSEAHFATFPPALIEPCIKAGTSEKGCCAKCGAPWGRLTERIDQGFNGSKYGEAALAATGGAKTGGTAKSTLGSGNGKLTGKQETLGWSPSCSCHADTGPCTILDPFGGAGTTALVADRLGRNAILIELSPEYAAMAERRLSDDAGMFASVAAE